MNCLHFCLRFHEPRARTAIFVYFWLQVIFNQMIYEHFVRTTESKCEVPPLPHRTPVPLPRGPLSVSVCFPAVCVPFENHTPKITHVQLGILLPLHTILKVNPPHSFHWLQSIHCMTDIFVYEWPHWVFRLVPVGAVPIRATWPSSLTHHGLLGESPVK